MVLAFFVLLWGKMDVAAALDASERGNKKKNLNLGRHRRSFFFFLPFLLEARRQRAQIYVSDRAVYFFVRGDSLLTVLVALFVDLT